MQKMTSWILVLVQLGMIGVIILTGSVLVRGLLIGFQIGGLLLGISALFVMIQRSSFRAVPEPAEQAVLLTQGPYQLIRNPMYAAILLILIPSVVTYPSLLRFAAEKLQISTISN